MRLATSVVAEIASVNHKFGRHLGGTRVAAGGTGVLVGALGAGGAASAAYSTATLRPKPKRPQTHPVVASATTNKTATNITLRISSLLLIKVFFLLPGKFGAIAKAGDLENSDMSLSSKKTYRPGWALIG